MKFDNKNKQKFIDALPDIAFNTVGCLHASKSKFNFSYFDPAQSPPGQNFDEWTQEQLSKLLDKIKEYSNNPLTYWLHQRCGGGGRTIFKIYGKFPNKSEFVHPKHIPKNVEWACFRLEGAMRLVGFIIPSDLHGVKSSDGCIFDSNVFYVVFLDKDHLFYKSE